MERLDFIATLMVANKLGYEIDTTLTVEELIDDAEKYIEDNTGNDDKIEVLNNLLTVAEEFDYEIDTTLTVEELINDAKDCIETNTDEDDAVEIDVILEGKKNNLVEVMPDGVEINVTGDFLGFNPKKGRQRIYTYVGNDAKVYHIYTTL